LVRIEFDWDDENTKHLAAHKVSRTEFEQAIANDPLDLDCDVVDTEYRYRSVGITTVGRFLLTRVDNSQRQNSPRHGVSSERLKQKRFSEQPMNKQTRQAERIVVPKFATEAEEAEWWFKNRKAHDKLFAAAVGEGEAQVLTQEKLLARIKAAKKKPAPVVALRIPAADLALARKQAEQKGLPYQTYIKSILHETLAQREKRKAG